MKHILTILSFFTLLSCHTAQTVQVVAPTPSPASKPASFVTWDKKMVDLGTVKKGEKRNTFFEFTNTSGEDVQIDIVDACECTHIEFPRGVFKPGEKGRLDVEFDSKDKEESETIGITVVFKQNDEKGNPRIESVEYKFGLVK
jgi:peptidoglycan-associated lipoprotein